MVTYTVITISTDDRIGAGCYPDLADVGRGVGAGHSRACVDLRFGDIVPTVHDWTPRTGVCGC